MNNKINVISKQLIAIGLKLDENNTKDDLKNNINELNSIINQLELISNEPPANLIPDQTKSTQLDLNKLKENHYSHKYNRNNENNEQKEKNESKTETNLSQNNEINSEIYPLEKKSIKFELQDFKDETKDENQNVNSEQSEEDSVFQNHSINDFEEENKKNTEEIIKNPYFNMGNNEDLNIGKTKIHEKYINKNNTYEPKKENTSLNSKYEPKNNLLHNNFSSHKLSIKEKIEITNLLFMKNSADFMNFVNIWEKADNDDIKENLINKYYKKYDWGEKELILINKYFLGND